MNDNVALLAISWMQYYREGWYFFERGNSPVDPDLIRHFAKSYADKKVGLKE